MMDTACMKIIPNKRFVGFGILVFISGIFIYLLDRSPATVYFFPFLGSVPSSMPSSTPIFGTFGLYLPTAIHVLAFILITAGLVTYSKRKYLTIVAFWLSLNLVFEVGQYYKQIAFVMIPDWFTAFPVLDNIRPYFLLGTFDPKDVLAALIGAVAGAVIINYRWKGLVYVSSKSARKIGGSMGVVG